MNLNDFIKVQPYKKVIALKLPDGTNYYCGKIRWKGGVFDEWDTDINYALVYENKLTAKKRLSIVRKAIGQSRAKLKDYQTELNKYNAKQDKQNQQ